VGGLTPAPVPATRRWAADPLTLLALVSVLAGAVAVRQLVTDDVTWVVPALLGVVAAGLALSGST
jgi:hypothetical protein